MILEVLMSVKLIKANKKVIKNPITVLLQLNRSVNEAEANNELMKLVTRNKKNSVTNGK